jgi:hypothetical protein
MGGGLADELQVPLLCAKAHPSAAKPWRFAFFVQAGTWSQHATMPSA